MGLWFRSDWDEIRSGDARISISLSEYNDLKQRAVEADE